MEGLEDDVGEAGAVVVELVIVEELVKDELEPADDVIFVESELEGELVVVVVEDAAGFLTNVGVPAADQKESIRHGVIKRVSPAKEKTF